MSLQVWLPLNGDLKNQGLSSVQVIASGATINDAGKIGRCYNFDGSDDYISLNSPTLYSIFSGEANKFSIAFWVYHNEAGRAIIFGDYNLTGSISFNVELTAAHLVRFYWAGAPDKIFTNSTCTQATWVHICIVYDGNKIYCYKDGVVVDIYTGTLTAKSKTSGDFYLGRDKRTGDTALNGKLNDFRIYDHALSAKEVKEISNGLVLHYKLDNGGGKPNNIQKSKIINRGCTSFTYNTATAEWTAVCPVNSSQWGVGFYIGDTNIKWKYGESWIISMEVYTPQGITWNCDINNKPDVEDVSPYTGNDYDVSSQRYTYTNGTSSKTLQAGWNKIWFSQTASNSTYGLYNYSTNWGIVTSSLSDSITIKIKNIKGEIISVGETIKPTNYIPNDLDTSKIYDVSGYNHPATPISTTISNNTIHYSAATHFENGQYIRVDQRPASILPTDGLTVNLWMYCTSFSNPISCTEGGGWNLENSSGIQFPVYVSGVGYKVANSGVQPSTLLNGWHMLTGTFNRTTVKIYIDGVLKKTTDTGSTAGIGYANNYLFIGAEASGNSTTPASSAYVGNISDIRIYAVALSAEDILELYNTSASIDRNGNVYAREVIEQ